MIALNFSVQPKTWRDTPSGLPRRRSKSTASSDTRRVLRLDSASTRSNALTKPYLCKCDALSRRPKTKGPCKTLTRITNICTLDTVGGLAGAGTHQTCPRDAIRHCVTLKRDTYAMISESELWAGRAASSAQPATYRLLTT